LIGHVIFYLFFYLNPNVLILQKASRPPQDRTMVVATLAEVAQNIGAPIAGYVDVIIFHC